MSAGPALRPCSREELTQILGECAASARALEIVGGGTHRPPAPRGGIAGARLHTGGLDRVIEYAPADLTVTVEGGVEASALADLLATEGQGWPQADIRPGSTVGGILASGASGGRRLREGPVRDSLLEVVVATGDGRLVTGGGRTVKNVSGFDLPRLMVGAHGTLGVIVQVTLKLWPAPARAVWFRREGAPAQLLEPAAALAAAPVRPAAVLLTPAGLHLELVGPAADVVAPEGFAPCPGGPEPVAGETLMRVGVPPARLAVLVRTLQDEGLDFCAAVGVGTCEVSVSDEARAGELRAHARLLGGHAVLVRDALGLAIDPWGPSPEGAVQMDRLRRAFDPPGILNPGRIAGDFRAGARGSAA